MGLSSLVNQKNVFDAVVLKCEKLHTCCVKLIKFCIFSRAAYADKTIVPLVFPEGLSSRPPALNVK